MTVLGFTVPGRPEGRRLLPVMVPVGLVIAGPVADLIAVQVWYIAAGLTVILMSIATISVRSARDVEETKQTKEAVDIETHMQDVVNPS